MTATTPALKIPYPLAGDAVTDYPTTGRELAELLETLLRDVSAVRHSGAASNGANVRRVAPASCRPRIAFTADGVSSYEVAVSARVWTCNVAGTQLILDLDLDGAQASTIATANVPTAGAGQPLSARGVIKPAAGPHTLNARLYHGGPAGTATIAAGDGTGANDAPILVTVRAILPAVSARSPRSCDEARGVLPPAHVDARTSSYGLP